MENFLNYELRLSSWICQLCSLAANGLIWSQVPWDALKGINQLTGDTNLAPTEAGLIWNRCVEDYPINQHRFFKKLEFEIVHKLVSLINFKVNTVSH